ncbi:MAG: DUF4126 domain-containing protein [Caulobacteraceae bacterium]|nr:MAG: DUF4126 domain-containing protein [Caulobacteraceae bacterium]
MIRSLLIGLVAGARSMTPLAAVSEAARAGRLPVDSGAPGWLGHPVVAAGSKLLAAGELWGDKWKSAPDRIVPAGLAARLVTAGIAGAALAPRRHAVAGGLLAATAAVVASYVTFELRMRALRRYGQASSGLVEDVLVVGATEMIVEGAR